MFDTFNRQDIKRIWWKFANWNDTYWSPESVWHNKSRSFCYKNLKQSDSLNKVFSALGPPFRSTLCDQIFLVETENKLSDFGKISGGIF